MKYIHTLRLFLVSLILVLTASSFVEASKVEFSFEVPLVEGGNPFSREIWATLVKPSGEVVQAPAYYQQGERFAVRIFGDEKGEYTVSSVWESDNRIPVVYSINDLYPLSVRIDDPMALPFIGIDSAAPRSFTASDGSIYVPVGGNLPWPPSEKQVESYYQERLEQFSEAGFNWTRIWMASWGGLALDWLDDDVDRTLEIGKLDKKVAENWDYVVELAETKGIYIQVVFQYHGQLSTSTDSEWENHPWMADLPGGFLQTPTDFFTLEEARKLTRQKYRYIVARWGYSPAILGWELFNEVHWVDTLRQEGNFDLVAEWHDEMAAFVRSLDVHRHLITTSVEDLDSPIYNSMDYLQPHYYPVNMLDNMRYVEDLYYRINKPSFIGEFGDDKLSLTREQKEYGVSNIPPIWASIMGQMHLPAQSWYIDMLVDAGNLYKLEAIARFLQATKLAEREDLEPFSPPLSSEQTMPLVITPGHIWMNRKYPEVDIPVDGSEPISLALFPGIMVSDGEDRSNRFPGRVSINADFPQSETLKMHFRLNDGGGDGATVEVIQGDDILASHTWPDEEERGDAGTEVELLVDIPAGPQTFVVRNLPDSNWIYFDDITTSLVTPLIAAAGRRGENFLAVWLWHKKGVFEVDPKTTASAIMTLPDVSSGTWTVQWWNTHQGEPVSEAVIEHPGGDLKVETPAIAAHTAVVLRKE